MIHPALEPESLLSVLVLLAAVWGRRADRRDLELALDDESWFTTSLVGPNNFGADAKRFAAPGAAPNSDKSAESMGVAG